MELVVLSGKGGTGKTTIAISLGELVKDVIKVDCDVDAPNMYLFYKGEDVYKEDFSGEKKAIIDPNLCIKCEKCVEYCKFDAIDKFKVNEYKCEGCGACTLVCPSNAIKLVEVKNADIFITKTKNGIISRAEMEIGSEGSGKLIVALRNNAKDNTKGEELIIIDGSPGIGCPVISSVTGSDYALIVTEPTKSGLSDLKRVVELCKHFETKILVCINKYDINEDIAKEIEDYCSDNKLKLVGRIPYDKTVIKSINELKPIIYYEESTANKAIREMYNKIKEAIY